MKITRISPLTGRENTLDLPVTAGQMAEFEGWPRRMIQLIFPQLTAAEREFIKTGYTAEDWDTLFAGDTEASTTPGAKDLQEGD